jgi:hypothetical protein
MRRKRGKPRAACTAAVPLRCIRDLILINAAIVQKRNQGSSDAFFK